jgi:hypothetical protein
MEVYLYGRLRRFAANKEVAGESVVKVSAVDGDTIESVLRRIGIELAEASNLFLNGEASLPSRRVSDSDRLGVFPRDMALLYRQYFKRRE